MEDYVICFDLDDTLYKEIDFLQSAYHEIASYIGHIDAVGPMIDWYYHGINVFEKLIGEYSLSVNVSDLLKIYREHFPMISLENGIKEYLDKLKDYGAKLGLITDGRSITQRNKIKALGLEGYFDIEIISEEFGSEKPCEKNYLSVMEAFPDRHVFMYVGDNIMKDFVAPNRLGWRTYCLTNDGRNINGQRLSLSKEYMPQHMVRSIESIINFE